MAMYAATSGTAGLVHDAFLYRAADEYIGAIMIFLQQHQVSPGLAARIYKRFGAQAIEIVSRAPYRLAMDVWGVGFKTADRIARSIGVGADARLIRRDYLLPNFIVNCAALVGSVNYVTDFAADVVDVNMRMLLNIYKVAQQLRDIIVINPIANCAFPGVISLNSPMLIASTTFSGSKRILSTRAQSLTSAAK